MPIPKKPNLVRNAIAQQIKTSANSLTISEWNEVVNVLKQQANLNTSYLEALHRMLFCDYDSNTTGIIENIDLEFLVSLSEALSNLQAESSATKIAVDTIIDAHKAQYIGNSYLYQGMVVNILGLSTNYKACDTAIASNPNGSMVSVVKDCTVSSGYTPNGGVVTLTAYESVPVPVLTAIIESVSNVQDIIDAYNSAVGGTITSLSQVPAGTKLYLSSIDPGKYSFEEPVRPNEIILVATVVSFNNDNTGTIFVYPQLLRNYGASEIHYIGTDDEVPEYADPSDMIIVFEEE